MTSDGFGNIMVHNSSPIRDGETNAVARIPFFALCYYLHFDLVEVFSRLAQSSKHGFEGNMGKARDAFPGLGDMADGKRDIVDSLLALTQWND